MAQLSSPQLSPTPDSELPPPEFTLRGNRFKPLTWDTMSPAQQTMTRDVLGGQRGAMQGPYNVLLHSPGVGNLAQQFGAQTRFNSSLPLALNELAILMIARDWTAQFVWWVHRRIAEEAGLDPALIQSIAKRLPAPADLAPDVAAVYGFCHDVIHTRRASDASYSALVAHYGQRGVVDTMATMSYYTLVSMALNVDGYPLPDGVEPELMS